jgi:hypothetical protein
MDATPAVPGPCPTQAQAVSIQPSPSAGRRLLFRRYFSPTTIERSAVSGEARVRWKPASRIQPKHSAAE